MTFSIKLSKRDWAGVPVNSVLGRLLRLPLRLIPRHAVIKVKSGPCKGMSWVAGSGTHGCWLGTYELDKQAVMQKFVRPGMTIYDIGANSGYYTLLFSRLVGKTGRVYAFEPLPENAAFLLRHIKMNGLENVTLVNTAVAQANGVSPFNISSSNYMGSLGGGATLNVPTMALDELKSKGFPVPELIKMDVEGAEALVLEGARDVLKAGKAVWFIALHGREATERSFRILKDSGYGVYRLDGTAVTEAGGAGTEIYAVPGKNSPR